jgi:hypothetical protein
MKKRRKGKKVLKMKKKKKINEKETERGKKDEEP